MSSIRTNISLVVMTAVFFTFGIVFSLRNTTADVHQKPVTPAVAVEGTGIGDIAPDIELPGLKGKKIRLSSLRGKVVLVDFWASWCGPCRAENPNVVAVYDKYAKARFRDAKGFEIYSVSLDTDKLRWKAAVKKDGLRWKYHVSDLKGWSSSAATAYGVDAIPNNFLLDAEGKIIAKNLRSLELHKALDNLITGF